MPALQCFGKRCGVAADDLVLSAAIVIVLRLLQLCTTVVLAITTLVGLNRSDGCIPEPYALFIFFIFGGIVLQLLILTAEWGILIVSKSGAIVKNEGPKKRNLGLTVSITARSLLAMVEVPFIVIGWFVVSKVFDDAECTSGVQAGIVVLALMFQISALVQAVYFLVMWDPVGCYSSGFISHTIARDAMGDDMPEGLAEAQYVTVYRRTWRTLWLKKTEMVVDQSQKSVYNAKADVWLLRLRAIADFTCIKQLEVESTLKAIAKDLCILFHSDKFGGALTPSDIAAALLLVKTKQKTTGAKWLRRMLQLVEDKYLKASEGQVLHSPYVYKHPVPFNGNEAELLLLQDAVHYFDYAIGIYGWMMYCFENPFTGCCRLARKARSHGRCCCCQCKGRQRSYQVTTEIDDCGCNIASLALYKGISKQQVLGGCLESELFKAPFCVIADEEKRAIVITIRGTMSFKDVLTDLSVSMLQLDFPDDPRLCGKITQVHKGMFWTAMKIVNEVLQKDMLAKCPDYPSIMVVGHSLGGGVASIIALLLRTYFSEHTRGRDVQCFAFSPPGCVFSYALAEYSQEFVTTFVYGDDFVPSLNWRSLLLLKHMIGKELTNCDHPKYKVFYGSFLPSCFSPSRGSDTASSLPSSPEVDHTCEDHDQDQCDLTEEGYETLGFFKPSFRPERANMLFYLTLAKKYGGKWMERVHSARKMQQHVTEGEQAVHFHSRNVQTYAPAFIPGRVLHIEVDRNAKCCPLSMHSEQYKMTWKTNEDFSVLTLGSKSLQSHLPNVFRCSIQKAAEQAFANFGHPPQVGCRESKAYSDVTLPTEITDSKQVLQSAASPPSGDTGVELELEDVSSAQV